MNVRSLASLPFVSLLAVAGCVDDSTMPADLDSQPRAPVADPGHAPVSLPSDPPPVSTTRCIPDEVTSGQYGTAGIDDFRDVVVTRDGQILVAGLDGGQLSLPAGMVGSRGVALSYGQAFTPVATLDSQGTDSFESIALDPTTERVWLAARTNDTGNFDFVLGELVVSGFQSMTRGYDTTPETPKQLAARGGRLAVAGSETRVAEGGASWINPFLATYKVADTMDAQWFTTRRHADSEVYTAVDISSEMVVVGGQLSTGELPGMFITAWNHDADVLWRHQLSTEAFDKVAAVRVLADGSVLWAGTTRVRDGQLSHDDILVGRFDSGTGESLWTAQIGTDSNERVADIAIGPEGKIYVAGDATNANLDRDVFLTTLDADGTVVGTQEWSSPAMDTAAAVAVDACGTAVVVGTTNGDLAGSAQGMRDGFVLIAR
jgi:hypothetical protein